MNIYGCNIKWYNNWYVCINMLYTIQIEVRSYPEHIQYQVLE
jgi:hypothetical protein